MSDAYTTRTGLTVTLRDRYHQRDGMMSALPDDRLIDRVAVYRAVNGLAPSPRLTPREFVCVVAELATAGKSDAEVALLIGGTGPAILALRKRHGIPSGVSYNHDWDCHIIIDNTKRRSASPARRKAAGLVA